MDQEKNHEEGAFISLVLRLALASLLVATAVPKFLGGPGSTVSFFQKVFKDSWLPLPLVTFQALIVPWVEAILPVWIMTGFRLRWARFAAGIYMISLAFGMVVAKQFDTAAHNYFYVLMCCAGLYFSRFDRLNGDRLFKK